MAYNVGDFTLDLMYCKSLELYISEGVTNGTLTRKQLKDLTLEVQRVKEYLNL